MSENFIILEGKNLDALVEEGMRKLNAAKEEIDIEVLESKKGLFGSHFKIKASLKTAHILDHIERNLNEIYNDVLTSDLLSKKTDIDFLFQEDGIYIRLNSSVSMEEIKNKVSIRRIDKPNFDLVFSALQSGDLSQPIKIAEPQEATKIDSKCSIRLSDDKLSAFVYAIAPFGGKDIDKETIDSALKENCITFGIMEHEIKRVINQKLYETEIKIAEGIQPVHGIDASLQYHFDTNTETKLLEAEDGKIDFKEVSAIKNVQAGQVLVSMTPATEGIPGKSVTNEELKARDGRKLQLPRGKNVVLSEDGLSLISSIDGEVKIIDGKVNVFSLYTVQANVDNSTGNIRFIGKVIVKGNVVSGFTIEAEGDVEVYGVVEGARIVSKGNIVLHRGIQGMNKGELYCEGDLIAKFIENSIIDVKGNIHSDAIMHSHVTCGKKLEASGKKGLLVGGSFKVSDEIKAKVIGSPMATVTELEVGMNPDMRRRYDTLKQEQKSIAENIGKMTQAIDLLTKISQKAELPPEKKEILSKSIQAKLQLVQKLEEVNKEVRELEVHLEEISKGKIKVSDVINPGIKVTIGSSMMYVKDPLQHLTLYKSGADIKIGPYEK